MGAVSRRRDGEETSLLTVGDEAGTLTPGDDDESDHVPRTPKTKRSRPSSRVMLLIPLILLALPSTLSHIPTPSNNSSSFPLPLPVACVLPPTSSPTSNHTTLSTYLHSTRLLASRGSKLLLLPERALSLSSTPSLLNALNSTGSVAAQYRIFIGLTYDIPFSALPVRGRKTPEGWPSRPVGEGEKDGRRVNVISLVGPEGVPVWTYYKRHLVPLLETYDLRSGPSQPRSEKETYEALIPTGARKSGHPEFLGRVRLSAKICHDSSFLSYPSTTPDSDLTLIPASVWNDKVAWARLGYISARARESGSAALVCGGGGEGDVSAFVDGQGGMRYWQRGRGEWNAVMPVGGARGDRRDGAGILIVVGAAVAGLVGLGLWVRHGKDVETRRAWKVALKSRWDKVRGRLQGWRRRRSSTTTTGDLIDVEGEPAPATATERTHLLD